MASPMPFPSNAGWNPNGQVMPQNDNGIDASDMQGIQLKVMGRMSSLQPARFSLWLTALQSRSTTLSTKTTRSTVWQDPPVPSRSRRCPSTTRTPSA